MARYGKETKRDIEEVLRRAEEFFGAGGLGMELVERNPCCLSFQGSGGHVTMSAARCKPDLTEIDIETREWDYQVKRFLEQI